MGGRFSKRPFRFSMWRCNGGDIGKRKVRGLTLAVRGAGEVPFRRGATFAVGRAVLPYALRGDGMIFCLRVGDGIGKERLRHGVWLFYLHRIVKI